jgi:Tol biopolymer transport system component
MIVLVDAESGALSQVAVPQGSYSGPAWSPTGEALAFTGIAYERLPTSSNTVSATGDLVYIADSTGADARLLTEESPDGMASPSWSPDGTRVAYILNSAIWVATVDGTARDSITRGMQSAFAPAWSPTDDRIAFMGYENEFSAVYLVNADGTGQRKLSPEGVPASDPAWSPDGQWIAYTSFEDGRTRLHVSRADGTEQREIHATRSIRQLSWSPDGEWIAFTTVIGGNDGPIDTVHLSVIEAFADDPDAHTLLRDLTDFAAPAWRETASP